MAKHNYSALARPQPIELEAPRDCAGMRLDQVLARLMPEHSRSRLAQWVKATHVTVDGQPATPSDKIWGGERLIVTPVPGREVLAYQPQMIALDVVHEDEALIVVNKPPGLVVHPGSGNWQGTLLNALLQH